jgi:hypothetical protein
MSVSLKYTVNGRSVSSGEFFDGLMGEARKNVISEVTKNVEQTRCPQHGQYARVTEVKDQNGNLSFSIEGCCDGVVDRAYKAAL